MENLIKALNLKPTLRLPFYDSVLFCFDEKPRDYQEYVEESIKYGLSFGFDGIPIFSDFDSRALIAPEGGKARINKNLLIEIGNALRKVRNRNTAIGFTLTGPLTGSYLVNRQILEDFAADPSRAKHFLNNYNSQLLEVLGFLGNLVDFVILIDPMASNSLISPKHFYDFCLPLYSKLSSSYPSPLVLHSPGQNLNNIEYVINSGIKGIQPVAADDLFTLIKKVDKRLCIIGNMDARKIAEGNDNKIYEEVSRCMSLFKDSRTPAILHSNFWLTKKTPKEKVKLLMEIIAQND